MTPGPGLPVGAQYPASGLKSSTAFALRDSCWSSGSASNLLGDVLSASALTITESGVFVYGTGSVIRAV